MATKPENLSKPEFWVPLFQKYPHGMKIFCDWIDEYKERNDWNMLFNSHSDYQDGQGKNAPSPKFHDLPLAIQIGIWIEFVCDRGGCSWEIEDMFTYDWKENITETFKMLQEEANIDKTPS